MNKIFEITFRITEICNLNCNYCLWSNGKHKLPNKHYKCDDIIKTIDNIKKYTKIKNYTPYFYFHGGEALTHPNIKTILDYIDNYEIELQTNLYELNKLKNILDEYKNVKFSGSIHFDYLLKSKRKLKEIYHFLEENNSRIKNIDLMYSPGCERYIKLFKKKFSSCTITYNYYMGKIFEKDIEKIKPLLTDYEINLNNVFSKTIIYKGERCCLSQYIILNGNGDFFKCAQELTDNKKYGNILEYNFLTKLTEMYKNHNVCLYNFCGGEKIAN